MKHIDSEIRPGARVKFLDSGGFSYEVGFSPSAIKHGNIPKAGMEGTVRDVANYEGDTYYLVEYQRDGLTMVLSFPPTSLQFISSPSSFMASIIEKFKFITKSEPRKSFQKAGVTDASDSLTEDGKALFLQFLLDKHGSDFKKDVVDPLLQEKE